MLKENMQILFVDDDPNNRDTGLFLLSAKGFKNVREAVDGNDALRLLREKAADCVISDYQMPNMDGIRLLGNMRKDPALEHVPFILVSGRMDAKLRIEASRLGVTACLTKPYPPDELFAIIQRVLGDG